MRFLAALVLCAVLAVPARATWSIVVVDAATGEVCVASATCLTNFDLQRMLPVLVPGIGAGASQSAIDADGARRKIMWKQLQQGLTPAEILVNLTALPGHQTRQYGLVAAGQTPITFTGSGAGKAKVGVTGVVGELSYAIQGNVLVGKSIVLAAEQTLLNSPGDLSQRVMAAMEVVRSLGGDGRCSCDPQQPTSCGVPPASFTHSSYTAFIALARFGDPKGVCNMGKGCANGNYYLSINAIGNPNLVDPVTTLGNRYLTWRAQLAGRPDALLSRVDAGADSLPADGLARTQVSVQLVDVEGVPLSTGGALLKLVNQSGLPDATTPGPIVDHGDGYYSFELQAGNTPGQDQWRILVDDQAGRIVRLFPELSLRVDALGGLHVGRDQVSASAGDWVPLTVNPAGASAGAQAGDTYLILGSASGTQPGMPFRGTTLPLNRDAFLRFTWNEAGSAELPRSHGQLDASARAAAAFVPAPGQLLPWVGARIDWSVVVHGESGTTASAPVGFDILP